MAPTKILVCRDLGDKAMALLLAQPDWEPVVWPKDSFADAQWVLENAPGSAAILVTLGERVSEKLVEAAGPALKIVSTMSTGVDHVDLSALSSRNIRLGYTPDVLTDAVADCSVMLALMASRCVTEAQSMLRSGTWASHGWGPYVFCGPQIGSGPSKKESTVGSWGLGGSPRQRLCAWRHLASPIARTTTPAGGIGPPKTERLPPSWDYRK